MKVFNIFACLLVCAIVFSCAESDSANGGDSDVPIYYNPGQGDSDAEGSYGTDSDFIYVDGDIDKTDMADSPVGDGDFTEAESEGQGTDGDDDLSEAFEQVEIDDDNGSQNTYTCSSMNDCPGDLVCDLSLGRCEKRKSLVSVELEVYSFHPPQAAHGDLLIIEGNGFLMLNSYVTIGSTTTGGLFSNVSVDENRIFIPVEEGSNGIVFVTNNGFNSNILPDSLQVAQSGVISCDAKTPAATYENGTNLNDAGPYAAGYLDILEDELRVFYPAQCGSIRRPPVVGEFPVVMILHGNGALHINYEYIGQLLATWGFISVIPASESENDSPPEVSDYIYERISPFIDADLKDVHPVLDGLTTTSEIAMIGHSRGCARMQNVYKLYPQIKDNGVASIWFGPVQDSGLPVPGYFMVFGSGYDGQSMVMNFNDAWSEQESQPRCKIWIPGGNHGLFGDHKVYHLFDGVPTITRRQQLTVVISFVLPLLQRAFALDEHWPEILDSPTDTGIYNVTCDFD